MNSGLMIVKMAKPVKNTDVTEISVFRKKQCLDKKLEHSLQLEAAMVELQQEFRNRSQRISQHVGRLGQLLGVKHVA